MCHVHSYQFANQAPTTPCNPLISSFIISQTTTAQQQQQQQQPSSNGAGGSNQQNSKVAVHIMAESVTELTRSPMNVRHNETFSDGLNYHNFNDATKMFCTHCGTALQNQKDKFCSNCGTKASPSDSATLRAADTTSGAARLLRGGLASLKENKATVASHVVCLLIAIAYGVSLYYSDLLPSRAAPSVIETRIKALPPQQAMPSVIAHDLNTRV
jgi:hypothetical protein